MKLYEAVNYRFDPFTETLSPLTITDEFHRVPLTAPFIVWLAEVPVRETPSSLSIKTMTETEASVPAPGEYRVDYSYGTGAILFNAADAGREIYVSYKGKGTAAIVDFFNNLSRHDPYDSCYNGWWKFEEVGDHFLYELRPGHWQTLTDASSVSVSDLVQNVTASGDDRGIISNSRHYPGYGFYFVTAFKWDKPETAVGSSSYVCGVGSLTDTGIQGNPIVGIRPDKASSTPGALEVFFFDTSGTMDGLTVISSLTEKREYCLDYTPGQLSIKINGETQIQTQVWISTTAFGNVFVSAKGTDVNSLPYVASTDFIAYVPVSTLVAGVP